MDARGFESALYRLSVKAIHALSGNTQDVITVQEAIERNAYFRPKLGCVQIWSVDFNKDDGYCDIHFLLSPDFMMENTDITFTGNLSQLKWIFEIKNYDYGEDEQHNKISEEDGIDGWLIKSTIKVNYEEKKKKNIELKDFNRAIQITESD